MTQNKNGKKISFNKKGLRVILGVFVFLIVGFIGLQLFVEYKITNEIEKRQPKNLDIVYENIDVNLLRNRIRFDGLNIQSTKNDTADSKTQIDAHKVTIDGLDFWSLINNKKYKADKISIQKLFANRNIANSDKGNFNVYNADIEINDIVTDAEKLKEKIPFKYDEVDLALDSLVYNFSRFDALKVNSLILKDEDFTTGLISVASKFNKAELSENLQSERDHVQLNIGSSKGNSIDFSSLNDTLKIRANQLQFNATELSIFRDKRLPDDQSQKQLYSEMLRKLPIKLNIDNIQLSGSKISYAEKVAENIDVVPITFENWEGQITNLSNTNSKSTSVKSSANLMGDAPIELDFSFITNQTDDQFKASVTLKDLEMKSINPFLEANAKVRAEGKVDALYFTIIGNAYESRGDIKMKYDNFEFSLLDQDRAGVKKTISTIANWFVSDGSEIDKDGYRYGQINVERDKTKSFFNYLWLSTRDGLKSVVTGNGEKE